MSRSSLAAAGLLVTTLSFSPHATAQDPCSWWGAASSITETCGTVGIGTASPANQLDVRTGTAGGFISLGTSNAASYLLLYNGGYGDQQALAWPSGQDLRFGSVTSITGTAFAERMRIKGSGDVGIGIASPQNLLDIRSATNVGKFVSIGTADAAHYLLLYNGGYSDHQAIAWTSGEDLRFGTATGITPGQPFTERMRIKSSGNVGIGLSPATDHKLDVGGNIHATGNISADGTIYAKYQDLAEWVPSRTDLAPGTVVVLDPNDGSAVMASEKAYDTTVAGVVSARPGIVLGEKGAASEQVATTGRVRVKANASRGPIAIGDLLVTSDKSGFAMRSTPIDVGGVSIHRPGTIVGKALEPLARGEGEILVLLSLQ